MSSRIWFQQLFEVVLNLWRFSNLTSSWNLVLSELFFIRFSAITKSIGSKRSSKDPWQRIATDIPRLFDWILSSHETWRGRFQVLVHDFIEESVWSRTCWRVQLMNQREVRALYMQVGDQKIHSGEYFVNLGLCNWNLPVIWLNYGETVLRASRWLHSIVGFHHDFCHPGCRLQPGWFDESWSGASPWYLICDRHNGSKTTGCRWEAIRKCSRRRLLMFLYSTRTYRTLDRNWLF